MLSQNICVQVMYNYMYFSDFRHSPEGDTNTLNVSGKSEDDIAPLNLRTQPLEEVSDGKWFAIMIHCIVWWPTSAECTCRPL